MKSIYSNVKSKSAVRPVALAAGSAAGVAIDTLGFKNAMFVVENGVATGTPTSYTVAAKVQECDTSGGSYTDVPGAAITTITADAKSAQIQVVGLDTTTRMRYLKLLITSAFVGGTSPAALVSGTCLLGEPENAPVTNSGTPA